MNPFDENAQKYDSWYDQNAELYRLELETIRSVLPPTPESISTSNEASQKVAKPGRWLEVGVGSGRFGGPLGFTDGVEPGECLRKLAAARGIAVVAGTAEQLNFPDETFEVVGMFTALEFFTDQMAALKEAHRVLLPNGLLVIAFMNRQSPQGEANDKNKTSSIYYASAKFFTFGELSELLAEAGFEVVAKKQLDTESLTISDGITDSEYAVLSAKKVS